MLPYVKNVKTTALSALLAVSLAIPAAPAFAWGQREQDVLKGVLGTLAISALLRDVDRKKREKEQPRYYYVDPAPRPTYTPTPRRNHGYDNVYGTAAAQAFNSYSRAERQKIQRRLSRQGYYNGGIDGSFGPGTYRAIAAYARDTGNGERLASRNGAFALYDSLIF